MSPRPRKAFLAREKDIVLLSWCTRMQAGPTYGGWVTFATIAHARGGKRGRWSQASFAIDDSRASRVFATGVRLPRVLSFRFCIGNGRACILRAKKTIVLRTVLLSKQYCMRCLEVVSRLWPRQVRGCIIDSPVSLAKNAAHCDSTTAMVFAT